MPFWKSLAEGDLLPQSASSAVSIEPTNSFKAYQGVESGLVEKQRGIGMIVAKGACAQLLAQQKEDFIHNQWPKIAQKLSSSD